MRTGWVVVVIAVAACGGDDDGAKTGSPIGITDWIDSSYVAGWFYDRNLPGEVEPLEGCKLLPPPLGSRCDPACSDGQTCAPDGTCVDDRQLVGVGRLSVGGTTRGTLGIDQTQLGSYELYEQSSLLDGATRIDVTASGSDDFPAFEIAMDAPLGAPVPDGSSEPGWPALTAGEDLELTWGVADPDSQFRLQLIDDNGSATLLCSAANTGSFTVPGQLIGDFLAAADFSDPDGGGQSSVDLYRRTKVDVDGDHRIELQISRGMLFWAVP